MSDTLKFADGTELALTAAPSQITAFADGQTREGYIIAAAATMTAEAALALISESDKTKTWSIVRDGTEVASYSNYTILAGGVTLEDNTLSFTLCKRTAMEIAQAEQAAKQSETDAAIAELSVLIAGGNE